jgi:hypothetical protein
MAKTEALSPRATARVRRSVMWAVVQAQGMLKMRANILFYQVFSRI